MDRTLFDEIIKEKSIQFRGIALGTSVDEVIAKEGNNFRRKNSGHMSHLNYSSEVGKWEDMTLYYGFNSNHDVLKIDRISCWLYAYPRIYWEEAGGTDLGEFLKQVETNQLQEHAQVFLNTQQELIQLFDGLLGAASKIERKDSVYRKKHQNFMRYTWFKDDLQLSLMSYLHDKDFPEGPITYNMKLNLVKRTYIK
ncbi:hypothetical protein [Aureispira anguillae]|uniref:Uncharacterized protein n=1 Tax=Aureispira anguillae TaxID=2864201 RepID=A0A915YF39_9BACT|nr:hypothetical protein [Aureispira anguillae]BDS11869.1 hypothetical protein AsAng_0025830 [Aureispira anguillae]